MNQIYHSLHLDLAPVWNLFLTGVWLYVPFILSSILVLPYLGKMNRFRSKHRTDCVRGCIGVVMFCFLTAHFIIVKQYGSDGTDIPGVIVALMLTCLSLKFMQTSVSMLWNLYYGVSYLVGTDKKFLKRDFSKGLLLKLRNSYSYKQIQMRKRFDEKFNERFPKLGTPGFSTSSFYPDEWIIEAVEKKLERSGCEV